MTILFKKPERKLDSFLVQIRDKTNNRVRIKLTDDIILQQILKVKDQNAHVIQCMIKDAKIIETMAEYDTKVLDHVLENCNIWFGTDLSEDKIQEMFLPSLTTDRQLRTLVSSIIEPEVVLNNTALGSFYEILPIIETKDDLSSVHIIMEIEAQGIYIRSKKFGIRWIVKSLRLIEEEHLLTDDIFDISTRMDVNQKLEEDIIDIEKQVTNEIAELHKKIRDLETFAEKAKAMFLDIEKIGLKDGKDANKEWATKTNSLATLLWNYQRSRLNEF
jgi:hypothetical protein